jgi:hypothetical protein
VSPYAFAIEQRRSWTNTSSHLPRYLKIDTGDTSSGFTLTVCVFLSFSTAQTDTFQALETRGVTLSTPPNDSLFGMFFKNSKPTPASSMAHPSFPFPPYMQMNSMNPYGMMPWGMPGMPSLAPPMSPVTPTPNPQIVRASGSNRRSPPVPPSDPVDMAAASVYPEITSFLRKLDEFHPKRDLLKYIPLFEELDFFNIDEISKLDTATALRGAMDISLGNATFLLEQVRGEMKHTDRERRTLGAGT